MSTTPTTSVTSKQPTNQDDIAVISRSSDMDSGGGSGAGGGNDEIDDSISEHLSFEDSEISGADGGFKIKAQTIKKNQLFDFDNDDGDDDDDEDLDRGTKFSLDELSGDNIAQHFKVTDEFGDDLSHKYPVKSLIDIDKEDNNNDDDDDENSADSLDIEASQGKKKHHEEVSNSSNDKNNLNENKIKTITEIHSSNDNISKEHTIFTTTDIADSCDDHNKSHINKNESFKSTQQQQQQQKEVSPLNEDVILINNDKISLNLLKKIHLPPLAALPAPILVPATLSAVTSLTITADDEKNNQNTENDILELGTDDDDAISLSFLADESTIATRRQLENKKSNSFNGKTNEEKIIIDNTNNSLSKSFKFVENVNEMSVGISERETKEILVKTIGNLSVFTNEQTKPLDNLNNKLEINKIIMETINKIPIKDDSLRIDADDDSLSSFDHPQTLDSFDINNKSEMDRILHETIDNLPIETLDLPPQQQFDSLDNVSDGIFELKSKILENSKSLVEISESSGSSKQSHQIEFIEVEDEQIQSSTCEIINNQMEKVIYSANEALDDITEESECSKMNPDSLPQLEQYRSHEEDVTNLLTYHRNEYHQHQSPTNDDGIDELNSNSFNSVISLNMLKNYEQKIKELEEIVATKDVCLVALNMQLESFNRRDSLKEQPSVIDSSSMATSSTEYRTYQDEYVNKAFDFQTEITEREHLIEQLTDSLQQSMIARQQLQSQSEKLTNEVTQLRKQLAESMDLMRRPHWMMRSSLTGSIGPGGVIVSGSGGGGNPPTGGDHESVTGGGQRISEISLDLVSESDLDELNCDDKLLLQYPLTDGDEKSIKSCSKERQQQLQSTYELHSAVSLAMQQQPVLKQIEQFQKYLSPDELRIFFMVQNKFNDLLSQEIEKLKLKYDNEIKIVSDNYQTEKHDKESEINRLRQMLTNVKSGTPEMLELRKELEGIHGREMEDLRTYFERKCADMEKQYSEEIFSQHSRRHSNDSGSEMSDDQLLPIEEHQQAQQQCQSSTAIVPHQQNQHQSSPKRKNNKIEILASPTHRKITPTSINMNINQKYGDDQDPEMTNDELHTFYRDKITEINKNHEDNIRMLKFRLKRYETRNADDEYMPSVVGNNNESMVDGDKKSSSRIFNPNSITDTSAITATTTTSTTTLTTIVTTTPTTNNNNNSNNNDSQVISQIIEEYETQLKQQVAMAKEDIVQALEEQIQALLSETATDDSQWPPELILLREKFTAKSQLEIAQLQIKHKEEMDRLKSEFEIQLNRKMKRQTTFDGNRDLDQLVLERDNLRELCSTFRWLLSELAKCISVCEIDLNNTIVDELHKHGINTIKSLSDQQNSSLHPSNNNNNNNITIADEMPILTSNNSTKVNNENDNKSFNITDDLLLINESGCESIRSSSPTLSIASSSKQQQDGQQQQHHQHIRFVPDVSGILNVIEDQSLLDFVDQSKDSSFNLAECVERLKNEAIYLLELSENLCKKNKSLRCNNNNNNNSNNNKADSEKGDSCEEEDGLKSRKSKQRNKLETTNSLNETLLTGGGGVGGGDGATASVPTGKERSSLPTNCLFTGVDNNINRSFCSNSEFTGQINDLRNRLLLSENERQNLKTQLDDTMKKYDNLAEILRIAKDHMEHLESQKEDISEGYGISQLKSPSRQLNNSKTSYSDLQNTARSILNSAPNCSSTDDRTAMLQQIEDLCAKLDRFVDEEKHKRNDLQEQNIIKSVPIIGQSSNAQIDAAYKQKKATSKLLEQQAFEWQQERDDFTREIDKLNGHLREKEKECNSYILVVKEIDNLEQQIREMTISIANYEDKKQKLEIEQKAYIDKIFVLREVISNLELQLKDKSLNEHTLVEKIKNLEGYVNTQTQTNESLHDEVECLKTEYIANYREKIVQLEDQLRCVRPNAEQSLIAEQIVCQLKDIEKKLDQKTRTLESLHSDICSASCSTPSEDVSVRGGDQQIHSPVESPRSPHFLPIDDVQRIIDKLEKHNRAEEAAIKRIRDLEMQINGIRNNYDELQHERDILQEKMSEQMLRISTLQSRLDEQRHRAEELHRQGTSDLNLKVYDLQTQLTNVQEKLQAREKQIVTLKDHLEQSKIIIDRLETDLSRASLLNESGGNNNNDKTEINKLKCQLKIKTDEIQQLKDKMRNEMINKVALPDLMETMLSDKNDEIDQLKVKIVDLEKQLQLEAKNMAAATGADDDGKLSARTLSDIVSLAEYEDDNGGDGNDIDEDCIRKAASPNIESKLISTQISPKFFSTTIKTNELQPPPPQLSTLAFTMSGDNIESKYFSSPPKPREINFSTSIESCGDVTNNDSTKMSQFKIQNLEKEITSLKQQLNSNAQKTPSSPPVPEENLKSMLEKITNEKSTISVQYEELKKLTTNLRLDIAAKDKLLQDVMGEKKKLQCELNDMKINLSKFSFVQSESKKLHEEVEEKTNQLSELNARLSDNNRDTNDLLRKLDKLNEQILLLTQQIESLEKTLSHKEELLEKQEKNVINFTRNETEYLDRINNQKIEIAQLKRNLNSVDGGDGGGDDDNKLIKQLRAELERTKTNLYERMIEHEKFKLDLKDTDLSVTVKQFLNSEILNTEKSKRIELEKQVLFLQDSLEHLKQREQQQHDNIGNILTTSGCDDDDGGVKEFQLDDITERVEKELNYSAQLDSNILKAIESDEDNLADINKAQKSPQQINFDDFNMDFDNTNENNRATTSPSSSELMVIQKKYEQERANCIRIQQLLNTEKKHASSLQEQDAGVIEAMRQRLQAALDQEVQLHLQLDNERAKSDRLQTQLLVHQRTLSRDNSLLGQLKSPTESPRRSARNSDIESELVNRLQSDVKLLTSQIEREKERVMDMERVTEREKNRYEKELSDLREYGDRSKREMLRVLQEKETLTNDLEHTQERLLLSAREIESLESRISSLQEAESRRASRRGKERCDATQNAVDIQELRLKLVEAERERDGLQQQVHILRGDIERSAQRETQLTDALVKEQSGDFLQKLTNIVDNTKEYRQMAETLQFLTTERHELQQRVEDLELRNRAFNRDELEKRANHLFGKYLRVESFRKALVHQKRYLVIMLQTYQDNEAKTLKIINGNQKQNHRKVTSFRSAVIAVIAIERMKFIVRRWQTGKRVGSEAIFSHQLPRRSASATTNNWVRSDHHTIPTTTTTPDQYQSPPVRDIRSSSGHHHNHHHRTTQAAAAASPSKTPFHLHMPPIIRPLQAPSLIAECSERLENLNASSSTRIARQNHLPW